ncbi:hypothetical protein LX32DRAFT_418033 [Colletotrichum zoysiae]|uniref:Uncharacterized protein n=1 Tax=Colletotrichum zoysiae TaxID=1216348 RepID=A0AAD9HTY1_9PEZI|nr:hypothetical protein LX32DRAFT_418033 [Colletotrichum zoysiae]
MRAGLVVGSVTTSEYLVLYVFSFSSSFFARLMGRSVAGDTAPGIQGTKQTNTHRRFGIAELDGQGRAMSRNRSSSSAGGIMANHTYIW